MSFYMETMNEKKITLGTQTIKTIQAKMNKTRSVISPNFNLLYKPYIIRI